MTRRCPFKYFKTSREIIRLAVMMYVRFPLSLRNVEDLLHERGIDVPPTLEAHEGEQGVRIGPGLDLRNDLSREQGGDSSHRLFLHDRESRWRTDFSLEVRIQDAL